MSKYVKKNDLQTTSKSQTLSANAHHLLCFLRLSPHQSFTLKEIVATSHRSKSVCVNALDLLIDQSQVEKIAQTNGVNGRFTETKYRVTTNSRNFKGKSDSSPSKKITVPVCTTTTTFFSDQKEMKDRDAKSGNGDSAIRLNLTQDEQNVFDACVDSYSDILSSAEMIILLKKRQTLFKEARPNVIALYAHCTYSLLKNAKTPKRYVEKTFVMPECLGSIPGAFNTADTTYQSALQLAGGTTQSTPSTEPKKVTTSPYHQPYIYGNYHGDEMTAQEIQDYLQATETIGSIQEEEHKCLQKLYKYYEQRVLNINDPMTSAQARQQYDQIAALKRQEFAARIKKLQHA